MRITAGQYKNRKLTVTDGTDVRPTSDRMRQTLFNIIRHARWADDFDLDGAIVLDLFCGSGALGIEALSQGADHCTFVDMDISNIRANASRILPADQFEIIKANATGYRPRSDHSYHLIFMDPPYNKNLIAPTIDTLIDHGAMKEGCIIIIESEKNHTLDRSQLTHLDKRIQGQSSLDIFRYDSAIKGDH